MTSHCIKTIVCYDDNPDYGGHQVMACLAIEHLAHCPDLRLICFFSPQNTRLHQRLALIQAQGGRLELRTTAYSTKKLQGVWNHFSGRSIKKLQQELEAERPDLLLTIQGEVEDASLALCAGQRMQIPAISYIPIPHRMRLMGAKLGALRDFTNRYLFHKPDAWITISESMQTLLKERGASAPIQIVHNGIDTQRFIAHEKTTARKALGLPENQTIIGTIGRVEFNQKQQDFLVRALTETLHHQKELHLVLVGDGPDREHLEALIRDQNMQSQIHLLPWQEDSSLVYSALDLLVIPSRFEGVPLVMLESLACGTPVIGSDRDGMRDLLPSEWTFETEQAEALVQTLGRLLSEPNPNTLKSLQTEIRTEYNVEKFQQHFEQALRTFLVTDPEGCDVVGTSVQPRTE